jgi:CubicO group peptidase (beta-lactamase class C family)/imidazolonepropionase-like amidohydrolase
MVKMATATALIQLVDQGLVDLDAPVSDYLDYVPAEYGITVRQLLTHSAGLGESPEFELVNVRLDGQLLPDPDLVARGYFEAFTGPMFEPGSASSYSEMGFVLLGQIVAEVSGQPYIEYVQEHILAPLGMENTDYTYSSQAMIANAAAPAFPAAQVEDLITMLDRARGLGDGADFIREVDDRFAWMNRYNVMAAEGGLIGPATEAIRLAQMHLNGGELDGVRILSPEAVALMQEMQYSTQGDPFGLGLGWFVHDEGEHPYVEHDGGGAGIWDKMRLYPEDGLAIVLMSNAVGWDRARVADAAANVVFSLTVPPVVDRQRMPPGSAGTVAFVNVTVIPMDQERLLEGQTVIIREGTIAQIGPGSSVDIPEDAIVVEGDGRFLTPGLSDMHAHLNEYENDLLLYLANGVTTIRELNGKAPHLAWRDEIAQGERPGPNLWVYSSLIGSSSIVDRAGRGRYQRDPIIVDSAEEAEAVVLDLMEQGYDGLKAYSFLSADAYQALVAAAEKHGAPVSGHIPYSIWYDDFLRFGHKDVAHEEEFIKILLDDPPFSPDMDVDEYYAGVKLRLPEMAQDAAEAEVWVTTTLALMRAIAEQRYHLDEVLSRPEVQYVNPFALTEWIPGNNRYELDPEDPMRDTNQKYWDAYFSYQVELAGEMHRAGVPLLAGTDANVPGAVPAFSLHDELETLVEAGLSPYEALRTSTVNPALHLEISDQAGTVEVGKRADLLLLDANPLEDISNTRSIAGVMVRGRWYTRSDLDQMLEEIVRVYQ